ncbi:hypothetical protein V2H45_19245 [Tumidithrix elongata RA019]|uniref:Uncharacterized protein n=1 Tax=Tumidithrix elongata BACA0141 TaxID=2716417 RepID=A0AAW9PU71_9CYAN|nr:hypothetical protein [Tumidithrix elongata RA019]
MITAISLIALGVVFNIILMIPKSKLVSCNTPCKSCGYQIASIDRLPALHDCPNCQRIYNS